MIARKQVIWLSLVIILIVGFFLYAGIYFTDKTVINILGTLKRIDPFTLILLTIVEVIIAPIPGGILSVIAGALFGTLLGAFYSWMGNVLGSLIAFALARLFGTAFLHKIISQKTLAGYNAFIHKHGFLVWLAYACPVFPVDIVSFALGLSLFSFRKFVVIMVLGFVPRIVLLAYFGEWFVDASWFVRIILLIAIIPIFFLAQRINQRIVNHNQ